MIKFDFVGYRLWAMIEKEFSQLKRDINTFIMIIIIPISQLLLLGYVINSDPKHLATVVLDQDKTPFSRAFIQGIKNTDYFDIQKANITEAESEKMLASGKIKFIVNIPTNFARDVIRNKHPKIYIESDAVDPLAITNAISSAKEITNNILNDEIQHGLNTFDVAQQKFNLLVHSKYNADLLTRYNSIPGLIGVILTMTMVMITSISITRDRESGTMETLLITPIKPLEVMIGKIIPHIVVGYSLFTANLFLAYWLFSIPLHGNIATIYLTVLPFIVASLAVGLTISTIAQNQFQAVQAATLYLLPTMILSGFLFPFDGMPRWAKSIGEVFPLTHYLRILRGILLKGNGLVEVWPDIWPLLLFMFIVIFIGVKRYRQTLD